MAGIVLILSPVSGIKAEVSRGDGSGIGLIGQGLFPNQSAQGFGDFTGGGFVSEGVGVEAINGQVLQGFAGEGRGERWRRQPLHIVGVW